MAYNETNQELLSKLIYFITTIDGPTGWTRETREAYTDLVNAILQPKSLPVNLE